jgi:molecular chaperone GrpE
MAADEVKDSQGDDRTPEASSTAGGQRESREQTIERLSEALAEKTAEASRNWDLYVRERADTDNFRKRMQREKSEAVRYALEPIVRDLLPVIDNLERAVEHAAAGGNGQPLLQGVQLVLKNALDVLERHGVTRIDATGESFDPTRHEAVAQVPDLRTEPNQVVKQFAPGYALHDRLIRAAQVGVSAKPPVESTGSDD